MRITNQSLSYLINRGLQQAYNRLARTQEAVTTGKRINRLADDPIGAVRVMELRSFQGSLDQYEKNIHSLLPALEVADSMLDDALQQINRAKELALAMANDTVSPEQRSATAREAREILQTVLNIGNTKVDNRYIFAGFINGAPPFTEGAGAVAYGGDSGEVAVQVSASANIPLNIPGDAAFQGVGVSGGVDIFDVLLDFEAALQNNDLSGPDGIRTQIGRFDSAVDQLLAFRAELGARIGNAEVAQDAVSVMKLRTVEQRSDIEDADALAVYSDFTRHEQALQAALQSAARLVQPSLLDFVR